MILVLDVGNTNIVLGVYKGDDLITNWRISTNRQQTADEYGMLISDLFRYHNLDKDSIEAIIISSVVPPIMPMLEEMSRNYFGLEPLIVGPGIKTGMPILYENPREIGADRVVNAIAGFEKYGGPLIIVDFGTATTFCVISAKGEYLGGCITPGIGIATEALFQRAAKLPRIELVKPKKIIGKNTISSMQAGIIYGYIGQVDGIVERIKEEISGELFVIATGGMASLIAEESKTVQKVDKWLTLDGLKIIYQRNKQ